MLGRSQEPTVGPRCSMTGPGHAATKERTLVEYNSGGSKVLTYEGTLTATRTVDAKSSEVFRAFTNTGALRDWLCNSAQVDLRKGGRIYLWWNEGYHAAGTF